MGYGTSAELVIGFGLTDSQKRGSRILINMLQIVESKEDSVQSIIIELNIFKTFYCILHFNFLPTFFE